MNININHFDALIIVDMQNDFMPGGALPVPEGDKIVDSLNRYIDLFSQKGNPVFFTRDWHPEDHISFKDFGGVWPPHCIQNTKGAQFHPDLKIPSDNKFIISKGVSRDFDAYSGFQGTVLDDLLKERGVKRLFIGGVATDYCVLNTVLGGLNLGYQVFILGDGIKGVDVREGDSERALEVMKNRGAVVINIEDLK
ncbi:bifunctional nicotinamidase/pyrazinamidase [Persephonella sp.]